jgi:hypothetical protein
LWIEVNGGSLPERRRHENLLGENASRLQKEDATRIERECKPNVLSKFNAVV